LSGEKERKEWRASDALDADAVEQRYESWRVDRATALKIGGAAAAYALADAVLPNTTSAAPLGGGDVDLPWTATTKPVPLGRTHVIPSNAHTVVQGLFDVTREPVAVIDSGDVLVYPHTWTHFLNKLQPGVPAAQLAAYRRNSPGRGVHSIIGPVKVNGAAPGDLLEVRFLLLRTIDFGANFHNPGDMHTGSLPADFPDGHVHYFDLSSADGYVAFSPKIKLEMKPFQGTFGVAAKSGQTVSSVAPGQHAGNIDVKELTAGSTLFVPVWNDGALIYTGDSHALQGDGEVNITALETGMEEVRCQVVLHKAAGYEWPMIETQTHWLMLGIDPSLNDALRISLRNTIDFLSKKAGLSRDDAYGLASLAVDFRVSQMVDVNNGIHAMIPKSIFAPDYRQTIAIA
jgi:acetamidase/formamidase